MPSDQSCTEPTEATVPSDNDSNQANHDDTTPEDAPGETTMSKSQIKKLARKQRILERRPEKRRLEREKNRLKRQEAAAIRRAQEASGEPPELSEKPKIKLMSESCNKFRVVIDMDFEDLMTDDEIAKAAKQVARTYSLNRHSENPCQLYVSSLKGKIRDRFAITCTGYTSWDINTSEQDYIDLFVPDSKTETDSIKEARDQVKDNIIYLTGDTDELLPSVEDLLADKSKIFVIGGLVDHNRHKNLCYKRAQERQIRTAKLPIKENLRMGHRHILSTVTVFEIMLNVLSSHKSWRDALISSIPRRKIHPSEFEETPNEEAGPEADSTTAEDAETKCDLDNQAPN